MKFVAIDVETANADMASICAVGAATFQDKRLVSEWYSLIDPEDYFDPVNISIHGIDKSSVAGAPTLKQIAKQLDAMLSGNIVVTHTHFDRVAMHQALRRAGNAPPTCTWLDSARVVRRTWEDCARSGYGLAKVCQRIGYEFEHHNALEDAKAAGHVLLAAMSASSSDLDGVLKRIMQPIGTASSSAGAFRREGKLDGSLFGEVVVFTGALAISRREAADLAASVGCNVASGVTNQTTLLVVGDMDVKRLAGHEKSSKHRKAESLVAKGYPLRIIRETDFKKLVEI